MINVIIFGAPGVGKGTQCAMLSEKLQLVHISTGDLIRKEIAEKTPVGVKAEEIINQGLLLDDLTISSIFSNELKRHPKSKGFLFDGYPRTVNQAEILDAMLAKMNLKLNGFINLVLPVEESIKRILKRAEIEGRGDDTPEVLRSRLDEYSMKTAPVAEYYLRKGISYDIDGTGDVAEINKTIIRTILRI